MPGSSNITSSIASSEPRFTGGGRTRTLIVRRSGLARRLRLAVDPRDGAVRLTLPARAALRPALAWAESKRGWIEAALSALPPPAPFGPGAVLPLQGREVTIAWDAAAPRRIVLDGDALIVGGPRELVARRVLRWLRETAASTLEAETREIAATAGVTVGRIGLGDPRGRWGSCTVSGDIRYSWRLILAPPEVRRATVAHEVAHRLHMHHGPAFHEAVADLLGHQPRAERAWLKAHGARLQAVGREE